MTYVSSPLSDRQRFICLLSSIGETDKSISSLLKISLRTVEWEKQRTGKKLGIATHKLVIWAVENRDLMRAEVENWGSVSDSVRELVFNYTRLNHGAAGGAAYDAHNAAKESSRGKRFEDQ